MKRNRGKIRQWAVVWACTKISRQSHEFKVTILWNEQVQTDRTILNKKLDMIICDNGKGTCLLIGAEISCANCDPERSWKDSKIQRPYKRNTAVVECINKSDTNNNRGNWINFKIIRKFPEQRTGNLWSQVTGENSHIGHCTHASESANVNLRNIQHGI